MSNIKSLTEPDKVDTYLKSDINMIVFSLQAKLNHCVQLNDITIVGKFKLNAVPNDIYIYIYREIQKVDGSTVNDSLELPFNVSDKSSSLKTNDIDILPSINTKAMSSDVYTKTYVDIGLHLKSYNIHTCINYDVDVWLSMLQAGITRQVGIHVVDIDGELKLHGISNDILKAQKVDGSTLYDALELTFNIVDKHSKLNNEDY